MATIKKGTYRFNDSLTIPANDFDFSLPFTTINYTFDEPKDSADIPNLIVYEDGVLSYMGLVYIKADGSECYNLSFREATNSAINVYAFPPGNDYVGWWGDNVYSGLMSYGCSPSKIEQIKLVNRVINVTADTDVDEEHATWFNANTKPVGDEATPAVSITYKGETISLNSGETVTLHTTEKKLTEDLVIKVLV